MNGFNKVYKKTFKINPLSENKYFSCKGMQYIQSYLDSRKLGGNYAAIAIRFKNYTGKRPDNKKI
jgi:hypothetical protein